MSDIVIKAEGIGKSYLVGHQPKEKYVALRDVIVNKAKGWISNIHQPHLHTRKDIEEFWAIKEVSFEVKQGQSIGIIGHNGAGKSTLLKILSRITEPTKGRISIKGRVASLLEVGTGFHPELTGRENIFLNGAILGMTRQEIKRKFDEIVDFAEVEKFLDTPVKHFSSGMYMRLAFAVAAHLEPEILVVDEILAVGDASFQKKCLGKMDNIAKEGRTVLFVSHNMGVVESLCQTCVWLEKGTIKQISNNVADIINRYIQSTIIRKQTASSCPEIVTDYFKINDAKLKRGCDGVATNVFSKSDEIVFEINLDIFSYEPSLYFGYALYRSSDNICLWCSYHADKEEKKIFSGRNIFRTSINSGTLNNGTYKIEFLAILYNQRWIFAPGQYAVTLEFHVEGGAIGSAIMFNTTRPGIFFSVYRWNIEHDT